MAIVVEKIHEMVKEHQELLDRVRRAQHDCSDYQRNVARELVEQGAHHFLKVDWQLMERSVVKRR